MDVTAASCIEDGQRHDHHQVCTPEDDFHLDDDVLQKMVREHLQKQQQNNLVSIGEQQPATTPAPTPTKPSEPAAVAARDVARVGLDAVEQHTWALSVCVARMLRHVLGRDELTDSILEFESRPPPTCSVGTTNCCDGCLTQGVATTPCRVCGVSSYCTAACALKDWPRHAALCSGYRREALLSGLAVSAKK
eukprot:PhM_4_TR17962/c0_g1_i1/m.76676